MPNFLHQTFHEPRASCDTQTLAPLLFQKLHLSQLKGSEVKSILILIVPVMRNLVQGLYFSDKDGPHCGDV